jgi:cytidine deaminase
MRVYQEIINMEILSDEMIEKLVNSAKKARENAYAPYSKFKVGASVLAESGKIYVGCNVENASYGLTVCAERNAIFNAVVNGEKKILGIAIIADVSKPAPPCGACRQVMVEFAGDIPVILENMEQKREIIPLFELLPHRFEFDA